MVVVMAGKSLPRDQQQAEPDSPFFGILEDICMPRAVRGWIPNREPYNDPGRALQAIVVTRIPFPRQPLTPLRRA